MTYYGSDFPILFIISIHTLRVEGDVKSLFSINRPPIFQSTPSVWRVTLWHTRKFVSHNISIHTLRVEGDGIGMPSFLTSFISIHTLRVEGDPPCLSIPPAIPTISIHTLRVEGDPYLKENTSQNRIFQSTPSVWRVTKKV